MKSSVTVSSGRYIVGQATLASGEKVTCVKHGIKYYRTWDWTAFYLGKEIAEPVIDFEEAEPKVVPASDVFALLRGEKLYHELGTKEELCDGVIPEVPFQLGANDIIGYYRKALMDHQALEDIFGVSMTLYNMIPTQIGLEDVFDDEDEDENEDEDQNQNDDEKSKKSSSPLKTCFQGINTMRRELISFTRGGTEAYISLLVSAHSLIVNTLDEMAALNGKEVSHPFAKARGGLLNFYAKKYPPTNPQDIETMVKLEEVGVRTLNPVALARVGCHYLYGEFGYPENHDEARRYLRISHHIYSAVGSLPWADALYETLDDHPERYEEVLLAYYQAALLQKDKRTAAFSRIGLLLVQPFRCFHVSMESEFLENTLKAMLEENQTFRDPQAIEEELSTIIFAYMNEAEDFFDKLKDIIRLHKLFVPSHRKEASEDAEKGYFVFQKELDKYLDRIIEEHATSLRHLDQTWLFDTILCPQIRGKEYVEVKMKNRGKYISLSFRVFSESGEDLFALVNAGKDPAYMSDRFTVHLHNYGSNMREMYGVVTDLVNMKEGYYLEADDGEVIHIGRLFPKKNAHIVLLKERAKKKEKQPSKKE